MIEDNIFSALHQVNIDTFAGYKTKGEEFTSTENLKK